MIMFCVVALAFALYAAHNAHIQYRRAEWLKDMFMNVNGFDPEAPQQGREIIQYKGDNV